MGGGGRGRWNERVEIYEFPFREQEMTQDRRLYESWVVRWIGQNLVRGNVTGYINFFDRDVKIFSKNLFERKNMKYKWILQAIYFLNLENLRKSKISNFRSSLS